MTTDRFLAPHGLGEPLCADATSLVDWFTSTNELHERIYAPYGLHEQHASRLAELGSGLAEADARIGFHLETACRYAREVDGQVPAELAARAGRHLAAAAHVAHGRGDLPGEIGFLDRSVARGCPAHRGTSVAAVG